MIGVRESKITRVPLMEAVAMVCIRIVLCSQNLLTLSLHALIDSFSHRGN